MTDHAGAGMGGNSPPSAPAPTIHHAILKLLASLRLTLAALAVLGGGVVLAYTSRAPADWALALPLFVLAVNLAAAVWTNPVFRRQTPLLVFHLALIAIALLVALGRLTYLKGQLELAQGEVFDGVLTQRESGPWHPGRLHELRFANEGFTVEYARGVRRGATRNRVAWTDEQGRVHREVIGDQDALRLDGYRFYTSFNKGFAPAFVWRPDVGIPMLGTVHLPAYPIHQYKQSLEWTPPGSKTPLWVMLQFDEVILDPEKPSEFRLPEQHTIVVRAGEIRQELKPGESMRLPDGMLTYDGLRSWMGYTVFYDFTLPWLFAAGVLAVLSLALHFWKKFAGQPWDQ